MAADRVVRRILFSLLSVGLSLSIAGSAHAVRIASAPTAHRHASGVADQGLEAPAFDQLGSVSALDGPTDAGELESFLDGLLTQQLSEIHIAGAAVAVVKDGEVIFARGYGQADIEHGVPIDPETTLLRIGSIGKLFTWTAVMQLVEQGKLDLDADINTYLDFRIPDTYAEPITLKHLMTHTSGFEDRLLGSLTASVDEFVPEREFLVANMPARMYPPGLWPGYANYNAMLAGYIVATAGGLPYDQYLQEHVFQPLRMAHSTARSVVPPDLRPLVSLGYTFEDGEYKVFPDYMAQPAGLASGGQLASAVDMGRFMIAHLESGSYTDPDGTTARILSEDTARRMQQTLFTPDPRLLGTAYGFSDWSENGQRVLGHQGYGPPMHSVMFLLPDEHLGVFVSYNTMDVGDLTTQHVGFEKAFLDHYYPAPAVEPVELPADVETGTARFAGPYRLVSSPATTVIKIIELFGGYIVRVTAPSEDTLVLSAYDTETRFAAAGPLYFRQVDGPYALVFWEDSAGKVTHLYTDLMPQYAAAKLQWYEAPEFNLALAAVCILAFLSVMLLVVAGFVRRGDERVNPSRRGERLAQWTMAAIAALNLMFVAGIALWGQPTTELHAITPMAKLVLGLGVASAVLTVGAVLAAVQAWRKAYWGVARRTYYTAMTSAAVAFTWFLSQWRLLGWHY